MLVPIVFLLITILTIILKWLTGIAIFYFGFLLFAGLFLYSLFRYRPEKILLPEKYTHILAVILTVGFGFVFTVLSIAKFNAFTTEMVDFGNMDQGIWNTSQGRILESTQLHAPYPTIPRLSFHVEFFYIILSGLFFLFSKAHILFAIQAFFVASSIYLIYQLAVNITKDKHVALGCSILFAFFPAVQFMTLFDIHGDVFAIPFVLLAYLLYLKNRKIGYYLALALALSCKEYISLTLLGFGISLWIQHRDWKHGVATSLLGICYFLFSMYVIIPHFNQGQESALIGGAYGSIGGGGGLGGIIKFILTNPVDFVLGLFHKQNLENSFYLFFPLAFICFRYPVFLLGALPILLKDWMYGMDIYNHHIAAAIPFIFISFIYGVHTSFQGSLAVRIIPSWKNVSFIYLPLCATLLAIYFYGPSPLGHRFWRELDKYVATPRDQLLEEFVNKIPASKSVSTSGHLAPHLTHRKYLYVFPRPYDFEKIDFILLDTLNRRSWTWDSLPEVKQWIPKLDSLQFDLVEEDNGILFFKKRDELISKDSLPN